MATEKSEDFTVGRRRKSGKGRRKVKYFVSMKLMERNVQRKNLGGFSRDSKKSGGMRIVVKLGGEVLSTFGNTTRVLRSRSSGLRKGKGWWRGEENREPLLAVENGRGCRDSGEGGRKGGGEGGGGEGETRALD